MIYSNRSNMKGPIFHKYIKLGIIKKVILRKNTAPALCKHQKQHEMWVNEILLNMYFVSCTMIPEAIRQLN